MRITGRSIGIWLLSFSVAAVSMGCLYLVGYWAVFGESWLAALTVDGLVSLPWRVLVGFGVVSVAFACMVHRLVAYAKGYPVRLVGLIACALALFVAMHLAIYEQFELAELYPFTAFFVVSVLIFRFETKVVGTVLFAVIMIMFYALCAKELGNRDAEQMVSAFYQQEYICLYSE